MLMSFLEVAFDLTEVVIGVVATLITFGIGWLKSRGWAKQNEQDLGTAIIAAVHEVKDTYLSDLEGARDPSSPGGVKVTKEEKEAAKERALKLTLSSLKGPALKYAKARGEDFIRGLIGRALDRWVTQDDKADVTATLTSGGPVADTSGFSSS